MLLNILPVATCVYQLHCCSKYSVVVDHNKIKARIIINEQLPPFL